MSRHFSVKCKHCGTVLKTTIVLSSKGAELDKLTHTNRIKCTTCGKTAAYGQHDYF